MNMPHPMRYIPIVYCVKCRKNVGLVKRSAKSKTVATLVAICHDEEEVISFAVEPGTTVNAFSP